MSDGYLTWNDSGKPVYLSPVDDMETDSPVTQNYQEHVEQNTPINNLKKIVKVIAKESSFHEEQNLTQRHMIKQREAADTEYGIIYAKSESNAAQINNKGLSEIWYNCIESDKTGNSESESHSLAKDHGLYTGKIFECYECGQYFSNNSNLAAHMRTHTRDKLFVCPHCGKGFNRNSGLTQHLKIHSGEKPHACSECGKCFTHKVNLNTHKRTHTGERPFSCSECGKSFSRSYILRRHKKKKHLHVSSSPPSAQNVANVSADYIHSAAHLFL
ncbi:gastrula zinc finger protein XlCGF49.1-like [Bombina bombina]|uniref:gastrula zinc finger protein XlCGF49.1-like n=1 Tax=Bombina bombina TaxID=8345 RepID=UPI00235A7A48|nr:gastrula zinc finger protein XlCGF49.1-like [Bombina bombina]